MCVQDKPSIAFLFRWSANICRIVFWYKKCRKYKKTHDGESFESAESTKPSEWWQIVALNLLNFPSVLWRCEIISARAHKRFETLLRGSRRKTVRKIKNPQITNIFFRSQEHKPLPPTMSNFLLIGGRRIFSPGIAYGCDFLIDGCQGKVSKNYLRASAPLFGFVDNL